MVKIKKKSIIIIAISLICILLVAVISNLGWLFFNMKKNAPKMTQQEISMILKQNHSQFTNVINVFVKYPSVLEVAKKDLIGENKNLYYYNIKNDIYIKSSKELENNIVNEIGQSDIPFIFDMLKFNQITNDTGEIYFVEGFDLAIAQGLVYTPDGEKPANMYIIELEKVDNNWFFFKER